MKIRIDKFCCLVLILSAFVLSLGVSFDYSWQFEAMRRIRDISKVDARIPLYNLTGLLFQTFGKRKFTKDDVEKLTGWSASTVHYKIKFLTDIGVFTVEEGRPNYYQFAEIFYNPENLELLKGVRELHAANYVGPQTADFISLVQGKIELILSANNKLNISITPEFGVDARQLRQKLIIGMGYYGLLGLFNSFSRIEIQRGVFEVTYNKSGNILAMKIPDANSLLNQEVPDLFGWDRGDYLSQIRNILGFSVLAEETGASLEAFLDFANSISRPLGIELSPALALVGLNSLASYIVNYSVGHEINYSSELFTGQPLGNLPGNPAREDSLTLSEAFIAHRAEDKIKSFYNDYLAAQKVIAENILKALTYVLPETQKPLLEDFEKQVLVLRFLTGLTTGDTAAKLRTNKEKVLKAEETARQKLSIIQRRDETFQVERDKINQMETIFQSLFNLLHGPQ